MRRDPSDLGGQIGGGGVAGGRGSDDRAVHFHSPQHQGFQETRGSDEMFFQWDVITNPHLEERELVTG